MGYRIGRVSLVCVLLTCGVGAFAQRAIADDQNGAAISALPSALIDPADYHGSIRLACVGDSITAGAGSSQGRATSWAGVLGRMLPRQWRVGNFGSSGRTLLQEGDDPYQTKGAMPKALASKPDVVLIMLGSNDSKPWNWKYSDQFVADYKNMIDRFKALPSRPRIILCTPPFVSGENHYHIQESAVEAQLPMIRRVAADENAAVIDIYAATKEIPDDFPDHVHPNDAGAIAIARTVYAALTGKQYDGDPPPPPAPATQKAIASSRP